MGGRKRDTLTDIPLCPPRDSSFGNDSFKLFCDAKW